MRQLTSLDAQFLALETARQSGHVAGLAILDPSTAPGGRLDVIDLQALIAERLPLLPPLRWRLAEVPLGLDYPYWVDDADFDLEFHVRELGLPPPGTDSQLADLVARITARPLDRTRPLWELHLIHGLEGGHGEALTYVSDLPPPVINSDSVPPIDTRQQDTTDPVTTVQISTDPESSGPATPDPGPPTISNPHWLQTPRDLARFYPARAVRREIEGVAQLDCLVTAAGTLRCTVVSETPANWGFGAAALQIAESYRMAPAMRDGVAVEGRYRMHVPFQLGR